MKTDGKVEYYDSAHCEAEIECQLIADRLRDMPERAEGVKWSHVGSLRYVVHMLREVRLHLDYTAEEG